MGAIIYGLPLFFCPNIIVGAASSGLVVAVAGDIIVNVNGNGLSPSNSSKLQLLSPAAKPNKKARQKT